MYKQIDPAKLRYIRKKKGISQEDLGKSLGITKVMVSRWENGKNIVDPKHHDQLCAALLVDLDTLCTENVPTATGIADASQQYGGNDRNAEWVAETILNLPPEEMKQTLERLFAGASPAERKRVMSLLVDLTT